MFIKYCVFSWKFGIFLHSTSSAAAPVFYLPGVCTHTDTEGKQRKTRVRNILISSEKTQYLMNTLYIVYSTISSRLQHDCASACLSDLVYSPRYLNILHPLKPRWKTSHSKIMIGIVYFSTYVYITLSILFGSLSITIYLFINQSIHLYIQPLI